VQLSGLTVQYHTDVVEDAIGDDGKPYYDTVIAGKIAAMGIPCFACTPEKLPELLQRSISGSGFDKFMQEKEK